VEFLEGVFNNNTELLEAGGLGAQPLAAEYFNGSKLVHFLQKFVVGLYP